MFQRGSIYVIFLLQLASSVACAQSVIKESFIEHQRRALTEKVFVHTDKETYLTGETIRFSLYIVDGIVHRPLDMSKVAYVEIHDQDNIPLLQVKIQLRNGRGSGSVVIPDITSGRYVLRAYTRWMRNFGADYFFQKEFVIINSTQPNAVRSNETSDSPDVTIRFFPEGGQLVQGLSSKVAFQATGADGKGIEIAGIITRAEGDTVAQFKTLKLGIGSFLFAPLPGVRYEAVVTYQGRLSRHTLPPINTQGYVLNVNTLPNGKVHVVVSYAGVHTRDTALLLIHTRQKVKLVQASVFKNGQAGFLLDKDRLGEGISHFTIFNSSRQAVCERLYFIRPEKQLIPEVKIEKRSFAKREKVTMTLAATASGNPVQSASLSVSVYKFDSMQFSRAPNILHYLLLWSDLKGVVESPEYYFHSNDSMINQATDNLMLTHGWRRFKWHEIVERKPRPLAFSPEYEGMIISGELLKRDSTAKAVNEDVYLSFPGTHPQFFTAQTDLNGRFEFLVKNPVGRKEALMQAARNPESYTVSMHSPFSSEYPDRGRTSLVLSESVKDEVLLNSIHSQAKNYFYKEKNTTAAILADSLMFYGRPDKTYALDDYRRFPVMEDVFREYVPEVSVQTKEKRSNLFVLNRKSEEYFSGDPLVLVDGVPVTSTHRVSVMPAAPVESLDVITQRYSLGPLSFDGIVSIKTSKGRLGGLEPEPGAYAFDFEGLQAEREFYSPVYSSSPEQFDRIPDFRNGLFWKPDLEMNGVHETDLSFYTSDETGLFIIVVQGLTTEGVAGAATFTFEVQDQVR